MRPAFGLWVTDPGVTTGQSLVTDRVDAILAPAGLVRFVLLPGLGRLALGVWLVAIATLARHTLAGRLHTLYVVCSRSTAGFVRDLPAYLTRFAGVRVVVHVHGSDIVDLLQQRPTGAVARWALRGCTLIVPSVHLVEPLARLGVRDCRVCENFVASAAAAPAPAAKARGGPFVVLWNSNVMASKGFFEVAEAVGQLHGDGLPVRMVALGAPLADEALSAADCAARLATLISRPWMDYRGPVDRAGARQALLNCDIVCLPSNYSSECQPLALLEAMCSGKLLLVADTAALRATVQDYPCEVVTQTDSKTLAHALRRSRDADGPHRDVLLQAAGERARHRFSAERFDCQMREVLSMDNSFRTPTDTP
jgi:glycosyltransferase involved in cell wall biosynthesis